jgi:hypothetical protein
MIYKKHGRVMKTSIIIVIIIAIIVFFNYDRLRFYSYISRDFYSNNYKNNKIYIEKHYDIKISNISIDRRNKLFEGIENETQREKYVISIYKIGTYVLYADEGITKSEANSILKENGFSANSIYFYIKPHISNYNDLKDNFYWFATNQEGKYIYIKFSDGVITYKMPL